LHETVGGKHCAVPVSLSIAVTGKSCDQSWQYRDDDADTHHVEKNSDQNKRDTSLTIRSHCHAHRIMDIRNSENAYQLVCGLAAPERRNSPLLNWTVRVKNGDVCVRIFSKIHSFSYLVFPSRFTSSESGIGRSDGFDA
jgi:hypothetical protein